MKTNNYTGILKRIFAKKVSMITLTSVLFLGITAFTLRDAGNNKWYSNQNTTDEDYSQSLSFDVHGAYDHPVKRNKLNNASLISDFIDDYPVNWITDYVSVEFLATVDGKEMKALGKNNSLSPVQKNILKKVELGTPLEVNVNYRYRNSVTNNLENYQMHAKLMVIPEIEAEYIGGYPKLSNYLWSNAIGKISRSYASRIKSAIVKFTVSETGEIVNAKVFRSTGDDDTDLILLAAITNMPKWKPAVDEHGIKVKQEFEFRVGNYGC